MPYNLKQHFRKTKLCPMHMEGHCGSRDNCDYAHSVDELRVIPDLRRTKLCPKSIKGYQCSDENCTFAHNPTELRACANLWAYKTSLCSFHLRSRCLNGPQCRFAHDSGELRPHPTEMPKDSVPCAEGPLLKDIMPSLLLPPRGAGGGPLNLEYLLPTPLTITAFAEVAMTPTPVLRNNSTAARGGGNRNSEEGDSPPPPSTSSSGRLLRLHQEGGSPGVLPEELRFSPLVIKHLAPDEPLPPALMPSEGNTLAQFPPPLFDRRAASGSPMGSDSTIASIWSDQSAASPESCTARSTTAACPVEQEDGGRRGGGASEKKKDVYSRQFLLEVFAAMSLGRAAVKSGEGGESHKPLNADAPEFIPKSLCPPPPPPLVESPPPMFPQYPHHHHLSCGAPPCLSSSSPPLSVEPVFPFCNSAAPSSASTESSPSADGAATNVSVCAIFAPRNSAARNPRAVRFRDFSASSSRQMGQQSGGGGGEAEGRRYAALRPVIM
eukprot:GHVS01071214.1.p1 GENE.GHVS01071214.1~~GHVS01071214.1.p1  ORF type:complete len:494 (+),score=108.34 GHVS01071214.1:275-1756(+)